MKESKSSALVIFISASLDISLIFSSPFRHTTFASRKSLGRLSISTRLRRIIPFTNRESLMLPVPLLNMETCWADASPLLSNTVLRALTIRGGKNPRAVSATLPLRDVSATSNSFLSSHFLRSDSICNLAVWSDNSYPSTRVRGWRPFLNRLFASISSDPHSSIVVVTPSPQSSSCDSAMETIILAAGCLTRSSATIFAPSLVTAVVPSVL